MTLPNEQNNSGRSAEDQVIADKKLLSSETILLDLLGAVSGIAAVINDDRQIVYANDEFINNLGADSIEQILGKRPGEAIGCIHSSNSPGGCGTSAQCSVCGAVNSILDSQRTGEKVVTEARISSEHTDKITSWDFRVTTSPITIRGKRFYVFSLLDISNEKRRQSLERIFFHDILNTAGNLNGLIALLGTDPEQEEKDKIIKMSEQASRELIDEIQLQSQLRAAENGDLQVRLSFESASDILMQAVDRIRHHEVAAGKKILTKDMAGGISIETDRILLQRVLVNLLKNALEATETGGTVFTEVVKNGGSVIYRVKNSGVLPATVKMQMFQRSFTTKGKGRGIGTYSIKLLTENYLKGKTGFYSNQEEGTVFFVELQF
jgi:K+-sensing histidine kinase KdpD